MEYESNNIYDLKQKLKEKDDELHKMRVEMLALYTRIKDMASVDELKAELERKKDDLYYARINCIRLLEDLRDKETEISKLKNGGLDPSIPITGYVKCVVLDDDDDEIVCASRGQKTKRRREDEEGGESKE
jgi:hypothetical protein